MICGVGYTGLGSVEPASRCDIRFDAEDWLYMSGYCLRIELYNAEHIAVVRYCYAVHVELLTALKQFIESDGPIEQ